MAYNKKAHLLTNTEAICIALALDRKNRRATEAERAILQKYSGFGGIKVFSTLQRKPIRQLHHKNIIGVILKQFSNILV